MGFTYNNANYHPAGIATASIAIATVYNKDPDADFIETSHENMDAISEYFKDHAVYKYCTDLTMDGQLKFKGKPVIAYIGQPAGRENNTTSNSASYDNLIKETISTLYGTGKFYKEVADV